MTRRPPDFDSDLRWGFVFLAALYGLLVVLVLAAARPDGTTTEQVSMEAVE